MTLLHASRRRGQRGQATTELLVCSWVILFFMAVAIQLFRVDRAVFKSLTAAHATHFEEAINLYNCADPEPDCTYDGGAVRTRVEWDPSKMPSVLIPTIRLFESSLAPFVYIESNNPLNFDYGDGSHPCPTLSTCKRTKMAAGTYEPICTTVERVLEAALPIGDSGVTSGLCQALNPALSFLDSF